jgi:hypothetical protein
MKKELYNILKNKYPKLLPNLSWGIECGDGWFDLLDELLYKIDKVATVTIVQIKEKFGTLRFYYHVCSTTPGDTMNYIRRTVNKAEQSSGWICETCGDIGELRKTNGWWRCICEKCSKEKNYS